MNSITDFSWKTLQGDNFSLETLKNKKVMIVNVASACGLTPQYSQLEELYKTYKNQGFTIIAFPCNDFAGQEPGTADEIKIFCETNYGLSFPLMEKINILSKPVFPLYAWLCDTLNTEVSWNFQKFLIDENGHVVKSIPPQTSPIDEEIIAWIEKR
jgi:glutathione peroxidase